ELTRRGFERVELWPPAVDSDLYHPERRSAAMRSRLLGGATGRRLLLTVSRLAPEKNVGFLVDVVRAFPDACLAVVGDGPARAELERRFEGTPTRFIGYLRGQELAAAYASADAFVYASQTETMGNVVLEAMASGCPVVAPRAGGIPSLLSHGTSGFLFSPGDVDDAVQCTRRLLTDGRPSAHISQAARVAIEQRNWEHSMGCVRRSYLQAIDMAPRAARRASWSERAARLTTRTLVSLFRSAAKRKRRTAITPLVVPTARQEALAVAVS